MSKKVLQHPDKEIIISKLIEGESLREIESWLKNKYPRKKRLHISYMTLQKFRQENLNIEGQVLDDIKNKRNEKIREETIAEQKMIIESSNAYQDKINSVINNEIDVSKRLLEMDALITSRIEFYYNMLQEGGGVKEDKVFLEYVNMMKGLMQDWKKYIEGFADKKIDHNVNINVAFDQVKVLKSVIYDILEEIDPSLINIFINKLDTKMRELEYEDSYYLEIKDE
tara:strand:+ start:33 stop:710 length:678 start_codon:yes stop_codon:yes gene_type:complete